MARADASPTGGLISTITASIKVWTADELIYGFSAGLLKPVTDTSATVEAANIVAGALMAFIAFYLLCIVTTWWYYARKGAEQPC